MCAKSAAIGRGQPRGAKLSFNVGVVGRKLWAGHKLSWAGSANQSPLLRWDATLAEAGDLPVLGQGPVCKLRFARCSCSCRFVRYPLTRLIVDLWLQLS